MKIHPAFRLNGNSFTREDLLEVGYSWIKEGEPFETSAGDFLLEWLNTSDTIWVKTSGSTGAPKTIPIKKEFMVNSALATGKYFELKPGDCALLCLSTEFIAGKMMLVRAMVLGLQLDIIEPVSSPLKSIKRPFDFCAMVPLQVSNSMDRVNQIKKLIIGGAPLSRKLKDELVNLKVQSFETYGMTETITHIAVRPVNAQSYETLPEVQISTDERGCLVIDAPNVSVEKVITNDLVELADKTHFNWLGRFDNIINSGGIKLVPEQIELKLSSIIQNRFFLTGVADNELGEKLILVAEGDLNKSELEKKILGMKGLGKFERPKEVFIVSNFVETPSGKVQREKTMALI